MPPHWPDYSCDDYLFSDFAERGHWDSVAELWLIEPGDPAGPMINTSRN